MTGFAKFAERLTNPARVRLRVARNRKEKKQKRQEEQQLYHELWKRWQREKLQTLLAGPHGARIKALVEFLEQTTAADADKIIARAAEWKDVDRDTRLEVLSLIDARCVLLRERNGLDPFDDDLDSPPATVLLQIREMLG